MKNLPKYGRTAIVAAGVAIVFIVVYFIVSAIWKPKEPQYAPDITGVTADGQSLYSLADNFGKTGTVLVFFNHDTGKAIELMQQLTAAAPNYAVDVVAVATGKGSIEEQKAIMQQNNITIFPHTLFDLDGEMAKTYNVNGTPVTYFIDKNGIVVDAFIASISEKSLNKALASIG